VVWTFASLTIRSPSLDLPTRDDTVPLQWLRGKDEWLWGLRTAVHFAGFWRILEGSLEVDVQEIFECRKMLLESALPSLRS
jgi:hypothetical protein